MSKETKKNNLKNSKIEDYIKENKKYVTIGGGIALGIILLVVLIIILSSSNSNKVLEGIFDPKKPIVISKDGKYGYITSDGKELIEPKYISASNFYFDYALVSTTNDENSTVYQIIDETGTVLMEVDNTYESKYIEESAVWLIDSKLYNKDLKILYEEESYVTYIDFGFFSYMSNDGKESGIINSKGEKVFTWEEDYITVDISETLHPEEGYYAIVSNYEEKELIINLTTKKTVFTLEDPKNQYIQVEDNNVFRVIDRADSYKTIKWMYFRDDKVAFEIDESIYAVDVINYEDKILRFNYGTDYEDFGKESRYAYYDIDEKKIVEEEKVEIIVGIDELMKSKYEYVASNCEGDLVGIKKNDKDLAECKYKSIDFLNIDLYQYVADAKNRELVLLENDETTVLYDMKDKKEIETFDSTSVKDDTRSTFLNVTLYAENGYTKEGYIIYNVLTGKELELGKDADLELKSNYIKVTLDGKTTYYNTELKNIYEEETK